MAASTAFTAELVESYVDNLELLELKDNKIYKLAGSIKAKGPEHFWVKDSVRASKTPSSSAKAEGVQFTGQRGSDAVRIWNTAQLFHEDIQVTGTLQRSDHIGVDDRFAFEAEKTEKAVAKDIERAMLYGVRAQGTYTDGTSTQSANRAMDGVTELVKDNATDNYSDATADNGAVPPALLNGYVQMTWDNGDREKDLDVFTGAIQKGAIDLFTTPNQRNIEAKSKMVVLPVDTIATNFGNVNLHLHREVASDDLVGIDSSQVYKAVMLAPRTEKYAKRGDSIDGAVEAELTVELRRPENCFFVTNLAVA